MSYEINNAQQEIHRIDEMNEKYPEEHLCSECDEPLDEHEFGGMCQKCEAEIILETLKEQ
jgi:RNA polymerase-binding transcription factor DksA